MTFLDALSLALSVALPFLGALLKRRCVPSADTLLWMWEVEKECLPGKLPRRWKPHVQLGSAWAAVYACMGAAAWLVWRRGGFAAQGTPLALYAVLLACVCLAWPPAFQRGQKLLASLDTAVFFGVTAAVALKFWEVEAAAGLLLLPLLGYAAFGAALLNLCLDDNAGVEVADRAQQLAAVECFVKARHPLPPPAAAAQPPRVAPNVSAQPGRGTGEAARTANQLRSATEAAGDAGGNAPSVVRSAFADAPGQQPREEGEGGSHVEQPGQLLDKVHGYLHHTAAAEEAPHHSKELLQRAVGQARGLLSRVWALLMALLGLGGRTSASAQVSGRLAGGRGGSAGEGLSLGASISGALQRVAVLRSPGSGGGRGSGGLPEAAGARSGNITGGPLSSVQESPGMGTGNGVQLMSDSVPTTMFSCPGAAGFRVRGPTYLQDKKKILPDAPVCELVSLNLVTVAEPTFHIARFLPSVRDSKAPLLFVWHVLVPSKQNYSLALAWALDHDPCARVQCTLAEAQAGGPAAAGNASRQGSASAPASPSGGGLRMRRSSSAVDAAHADAVLAQQMAAEASGGSGTSHATDDESGAPEGGAHDAQAVERSSKSLSALKPDKPHHARRHKRSQTVLDGSPPVPEPKQAAQQQAQQPPSQPATPLRRALWGSRAAAAPEQAAPEAAGPSPYAACDPFDVVMMRFLEAGGGDDAAAAKARHGVFKIIPRVSEGSWMVKQAVGQNTPVLLGRKLTTQYFRGPNYIEVDVDVGSSRSAANVVGLVQGALKSLVIDLAVLLEGHAPASEELPERLLGTCRLEHLDLAAAAHLDLATGQITRKVEDAA